MMLNRNLVYVLAALALAAASQAAAAPIVPSELVVFGDSLSDTGNVYATAMLKIEDNTGVLYDGIANFPGPTPPALSGNILVNAGLTSAYNYQPGRFTNGANSRPTSNIAGVWVEQLATRLEMALPTPSTSSGRNYAYGGAEAKAAQHTYIEPAGAGQTTVTSTAVVDNIGAQTGWYTGGYGTGDIPGDALYVIWAGGNDLINIATEIIKGTPNFNVNQLVPAAQTAVAYLKSQIQTLYNRGARCFIWPNLPPVDRVPWYKNQAQDLRDKLRDAAILFQTDHQAAAADLVGNNNGLSIATVDVLGLFNNVLQNPAAPQYMFDNIDTAARGLTNENPDKYVFWDDIHPTTRTHQLIASAAFAAVIAAGCVVPEPATLGLLLLALAALLPRLRHR